MANLNNRTINVFAHNWNPTLSYGRLVNELSSHLEKLGVHVNRFGYDAPSTPMRPSFGGILTAYPTSYHKYGNIANVGVKIAVTMWESNQVPDGWADSLNQCDVVVVPSTWLVKVFRDAGVLVPIEVVPLGVSDAFTYQERQKHDKFRVLIVGDYAGRKGVNASLFSFINAFGEDDGVELIIKSHRKSTMFTNDNIRNIDGDLTDRQMNVLYGECDMMLFPSGGEGFGLPPIEFAATGGVVTATDWSGMRDYIREIGIPIPYKMGSAWRNHRFAGHGEWAYADIDALTEILRDVRSWSQEERVLFGRYASEYVRKHFQWETFARRILEIWEQEIAYASAV